MKLNLSPSEDSKEIPGLMDGMLDEEKPKAKSHQDEIGNESEGFENIDDYGFSLLTKPFYNSLSAFQ